MSGFKLYMSTVTRQGTSTREYQGQEYETNVAQIDGRMGPDEAQILFGVGFASKPVENDRLIVLSKNGATYAIGGATQEIESSLGLNPGERAVFSTDTNGEIAATIVVANNGTVRILGEETHIGEGDEYVSNAVDIDKYFPIVDEMLTALDTLAGGIYAGLKSAAWPDTGGQIPSVASANLKSEKPTII